MTFDMFVPFLKTLLFAVWSLSRNSWTSFSIFSNSKRNGSSCLSFSVRNWSIWVKFCAYRFSLETCSIHLFKTVDTGEHSSFVLPVWSCLQFTLTGNFILFFVSENIRALCLTVSKTQLIKRHWLRDPIISVVQAQSNDERGRGEVRIFWRH